MIYVQMPGRWVEQKRIIEVSQYEIIAAVANHFGVNVEDIKSNLRTRKYVLPRNISYWFIRKYTNEYHSKIGKIFGRDHTCVLRGINQINDFLKVYPDIKNHIEAIEQRITA